MKERKNKIIIGETKENKKGGCKMKEKEERMEKRKEVVKNMEENKENKKGVEEMEVKQLVKEIETKKMLLVEKVISWAESLSPIKDLHIKEKGRYYPLLGKNGKLYIIDKVQGKKIPFDTLDKSMKFVISAILAERKEEIEKEVEEDKKKYLEGKLSEIDKLLDKF